MTFYFYDLETSGFNPKWDRIMQFAGQRTNAELKPIGKPHNLLVKLTDDVLPSPDAVLVTGITPQKTVSEGISEAEFLKIVDNEISKPDTCMVGFNNIRFDDEFMRYALYRNYYDPYEREWRDGRGRWDLIDVVRMMRALRPEGLEWPFDNDGKPSNRLELLTEANGIAHKGAHDALADVKATAELARLIKNKQPKLFSHLMSLRDKKRAAQILDLNKPKPVVYTSGRFSSEWLKTSVVVPIAPHPVNPNAVLVYDLRFDPESITGLDIQELAHLAFTPWRELEAEQKQRLPVKPVHLNKSPALAPLGVLDKRSQERIKLTIAQINARLKSLVSQKGLTQKINEVWQQQEHPAETDPDAMLYDGFVGDADKKQEQSVRQANADELTGIVPKFKDKRLQELFVRYKARNFPQILSSEEQRQWDQYRFEKFIKHPQMTMERYFKRLHELGQDQDTTDKQRYLLEELKLYGESIAPLENESLDL